MNARQAPVWIQLHTLSVNTTPVAPGVGPYGSGMFNGHLIYPEPRLYTGVGEKKAPTPFNGQVTVVGGRSLRLALGHWLLEGSIAVTALALLVVLGKALFERQSLSSAMAHRAATTDEVASTPRAATGV